MDNDLAALLINGNGFCAILKYLKMYLKYLNIFLYSMGLVYIPASFVRNLRWRRMATFLLF